MQGLPNIWPVAVQQFQVSLVLAHYPIWAMFLQVEPAKRQTPSKNVVLNDVVLLLLVIILKSSCFNCKLLSIENSVDPDFRMVLRKMSKRDSTTKIKALQELSTLCKEKDLDSVKTILPFWPRIFAKLATVSVQYSVSSSENRIYFVFQSKHIVSASNLRLIMVIAMFHIFHHAKENLQSGH